VSDHPVTKDRITVRSSRLWAFFQFSLTQMIFSNVMAADDVAISLTKVKSWLTPWVREEEHMPLTHIAELNHKWGLAWDTITVESSGGLNPLVIEGLPKDRARAFVDTVRKRLNEAPRPAT
jgi:hypothetical protein